MHGAPSYGKTSMTPSSFDVIVAGLGAMGSATIARLAIRGKRVLGLDRWAPGHSFGSSHGDSRIIREMYFEHPMYVPLVQRAHELWRDLEDRTATPLMHLVGGLMIGPEGGSLVQGTLRSAREHGLPHAVIERDEVSRRFPAFALRAGDVAVHDPRAGYLDPEACNAAHLKVAARYGAELRFDEPAASWRADGDGVTVKTSFGEYSAARLVLSVGARTSHFLPELPLEIERQAVFWFEPGNDLPYHPSLFPIWAHEYVEGEICYGFPRLQRGVKASVMHSGEICDDADKVRRNIDDEEIEPLRRALTGVLPALAKAEVIERDTCIFTNTPDRDFIIDFHPGYPQVLVSSACSGHGFKFASAIGEVQADLVTGNVSPFDLAPFSIRRFVR
jgi:sarcosine oxidase